LQIKTVFYTRTSLHSTTVWCRRPKWDNCLLSSSLCSPLSPAYTNLFSNCWAPHCVYWKYTL